jgi:hypothetical protein
MHSIWIGFPIRGWWAQILNGAKGSLNFKSPFFRSIHIASGWLHGRFRAPGSISQSAGNTGKLIRRRFMKYGRRILAFTLTMLPMMAFAQLKPAQKIIANVPFEFIVGNKVLPAGQWTAQRATMSDKTLLIRNLDAGIAVNSFTLPGESKAAPLSCVLVFKRYGDRYFLSGIEVEGDRATYQIPETKAEAELRSENRHASEEVIVASLR